MTFPFAPRADSAVKGLGTLVKIQDKQVVFLREINAGESVFSYLSGFGAGLSKNPSSSDFSSDYDFRIENRRTGAGVRITGDRPLVKLAFWTSRNVLSPEPYISVKAAPGEEFRWKIQYEFYAIPGVGSK